MKSTGKKESSARSKSDKTYKISIRGEAPGVNYCSCPDYSINNMGTCKHIEFTLSKLLQQQGVKERLQEEYMPPYSEVYLQYSLKREVRFRPGKGAPVELMELAKIFH